MIKLKRNPLRGIRTYKRDSAYAGGIRRARQLLGNLTMKKLDPTVNPVEETSTPAQMDGETMKNAGLTEDMIRFSVGIEDVQDIINDFDNGFRAAKRSQLKAAE